MSRSLRGSRLAGTGCGTCHEETAEYLVRKQIYPTIQTPGIHVSLLVLVHDVGDRWSQAHRTESCLGKAVSAVHRLWRY